MQNTSITLSVTQPSAAVQAQQIPMLTKRLSLTETSVQNLLTARAQGLNHYYTLQINKRLKCHGVTVTSDMNTVQKYKKTKYLMKTLFTVTNRKNGQKMAKFYKMAKCVFSWPAQLKNGQIFRNWP